MSDLDLDAIEKRHTDGYALPRFVSFALIDEIRALRERVATLEVGVRMAGHQDWCGSELADAPCNCPMALLDASHDQEGDDE